MTSTSSVSSHCARQPSLDHFRLAIKMLLPSSLVLALLHTTSALSYTPPPPEQHIFINTPDEAHASLHYPTVHESTVMARRILHLSTLGNLVTSFPATNPSSNEDIHSQENRPPGVENNPIGLMEYYADCEANGNPTFLAIGLATPYKNYQAGSNISLSVRWWPKQSLTYAAQGDEDIPTPHTPAALPRFSLHGYLETISTKDLATKLVPACFLRAHPDSILWQPGNDIHTSEYMRFVVEHVYWFGGFGDRARIGWLPIEDWRNVTMDEVAACRLPGEKGYKESLGWKEGL